MGAEASEGARPGDSSDVDTHARGVGDATPERYGPLMLERHVKDDGRALVLYTHTEGDRE